MIGSSVFAVVVVVVAGMAATIGYLIARGRSAAAVERAEQQHQAAEQMRRERDAALAQVRQVQEQLQQHMREAAAEKSALQEERGRLEASLQVAESELLSQEQRFNEHLEVLRNEQQRMRDDTPQIAAAIVEESGTRLTQRIFEAADQRDQATIRDMDQRRTAVEDMLRPLAEQLDKVTGQVHEMEKNRKGDLATMTEQFKMMSRTSEDLRRETQLLVTALRKPDVRGRWGEQQLRTLLEEVGMLDQVDFYEQRQFLDADNKPVRPDMLVKLGGGKSIVIDAKTPFDAFLEAHDARDDKERAARLARHAKNVRAHIDNLSGKQYWAHVPGTPEFVVMFMPGDPFFAAALDQDRGLVEYAFRRNVIIATPSTLLAMMQTVAYTWRQYNLAENAEEVLKLGRELHERLAKVAEHFTRMGTHLGKAVDFYNQTLGSMEQRLMVTSRRMAEMNVINAPVKELKPVDAQPRTVTTTANEAPETAAS
ncbi:DNA recombination protein RmuC [Nocardia nova]|uniref:DNA recombination protein RmuC n=1 Tax=Nocardia nova TaxID=37330 RepID=UPI000CEA10FA|nr:DNA recombination protein RmuC [Nocardia nova]PPI89060.1 DNA recombination protein RmuC [Nocardia nova]